MKKCPYCWEEIQDEAIKCKHCKSDLYENDKKVIEKNFITEEKIIYTWIVNWSNYIFPIILLFIIFPFSTILWIYYIYYHKTKKIILTNKKFTYSYWILSKKLLDIKLEKIESIQIKKNLIDMIFWSWTIIVSWTWWNNEPITWIDKPEELKKAIESQINK